MTQAFLGFVDNLGWPLPAALAASAGLIGFVVGSAVWLFWREVHPTESDPRIARSIEFSGRSGSVPPLGQMSIGEFLASFTLKSPEGSVFLCGSAASIVLAAALAIGIGDVPNAQTSAAWAALWPLVLFVWHAATFMIGRIESAWFRTICLASLSTAPFAQVLHAVLVAAR
jgi:hypothetical protein